MNDAWMVAFALEIGEGRKTSASSTHRRELCLRFPRMVRRGSHTHQWGKKGGLAQTGSFHGLAGKTKDGKKGERKLVLGKN